MAHVSGEYQRLRYWRRRCQRSKNNRHGVYSCYSILLDIPAFTYMRVWKSINSGIVNYLYSVDTLTWKTRRKKVSLWCGTGRIRLLSCVCIFGGFFSCMDFLLYELLGVFCSMYKAIQAMLTVRLAACILYFDTVSLVESSFDVFPLVDESFDVFPLVDPRRVCKNQTHFIVMLSHYTL